MGTLLKDKIFSVNNDKGSINTNPIKNWLITNYNKVVFRPEQRTLIYNGYPYGTAYQFGDSNTSGDVFGNVLSHNIDKGVINAVVMGDSNKTSVSNSLVLGSYNKSKDYDTKYIFSIGNGTNNNNRSNLFMVDTTGDTIAYSISKTQLDTSYVTTLGPKATLNDTLSALLDETKYYEPTPDDFVISLSESYYEYPVYTSFTIPKLNLSWVGNKPIWDANYVNDYITKNSKLPANVKLSDLSYTNGIISSIECNGKGIPSVAPGYKINTNYTFAPDSFIYTPQPWLDHTIYNGHDIYGFPTIRPIPVFIEKIPSLQPGYYDIYKDLELYIHYDNSQTSYYKQLADKNIFVKSDKNKFVGKIIKTRPFTQRIYVGPVAYYGILHSDNNYTTDNLNDFWNEAKMDDFDFEDSSCNKMYRIVTSYSMFDYNINKYDVKFTEHLFNDCTLNYFYDSNNFHYVFFGLPTEFISDEPLSWHYSIQLPHETVDAALPSLSRADNCNYKYTRPTNGLNYNFYIGKFKTNGMSLASNVTSYDGAVITLNNIYIDNKGLLNKYNND